eukprot:Seg1008.13 transcript_id=Seg1008.13/GoldUCD/mRNA.D3Y31 product="hypothetical protein" protein_id=Seg1008.13/GoldUCD/D3Y31
MSSANESLKLANGHNGTTNGVSTERRLSDIKDDMPEWKKAMLKRKNDEVLAEIEREREAEELEKQKFANVPGWKAEILKKKEAEKRKQEKEEKAKEARKMEEEQKLKAKPGWQQDLIQRRNSYNTA